MDSDFSNSPESLYWQWVQRVLKETGETNSVPLQVYDKACFFSSNYTGISDQLIHSQLTNSHSCNNFLTVRYSISHVTEKDLFTAAKMLNQGVDEIVLFLENTLAEKALDLVVKTIPPDQLLIVAPKAFQKDLQDSRSVEYFTIFPAFESFNADLILNFQVQRPQTEIWVEATAKTDFFALIATLKALRALHSKPVYLLLKLSDDDHGKLLVQSTALCLAAFLGGAKGIQYTFPEMLPHDLKWYFHAIPKILHHESQLDADLLQGNWMLSALIDPLLQAAKSTQEPVPPATFGHLSAGPGEVPFLRGPYSSMYLKKPWTIRQYAGFSTAEESNAFYLRNLKAGQTGLSVAFDLPTHRGYDSDHARVRGDVGMAGVAVDSVEDMKILFNGIDLSKMSVSMTMNGAVFPILAFYIIAAEEQGHSPDRLSGTIQNDILKEFLVRNTYIYPPDASMRLVTDIFRYTSQHMPRFNPISISGYHMHEAGASAAQELAFTLADGIEYVKAGVKAGIPVDQFAPRLSFFWGIGMNFFLEIAKLRAARFLWAELMQAFQPANEKSLMLRTHCQTSGWSLTAKTPLLNVVRTTLEALSAVLGHTQSLHTNSYDEALALPSEESAAIARYTQQYLQQCGITKVVDPMAGTWVVEKLTEQLIADTRALLQKTEEMGGMLEAVKSGWAKSQIEREATLRQAAIDKGEEVIIGVNRHLPEVQTAVELRDIDQNEVQQQQLRRLKNVRMLRQQDAVDEILLQLEEAARMPDAPLFELCLEAARRRATLGEISLALEKVFGRHQTNNTALQGVYLKAMNNDTNLDQARQLCEEFARKDGRRPRILVAKLGQDGHDRGAHLVASVFADMGFDVDLGPMFSTPAEIAKQAMENDVHLIGISSMTGAHKLLIPELLDELRKNKLDHILVLAGGIIPEKDALQLKALGVHEVFGPGTVLSDAAVEILGHLLNE